MPLPLTQNSLSSLASQDNSEGLRSSVSDHQCQGMKPISPSTKVVEGENIGMRRFVIDDQGAISLK